MKRRNVIRNIAAGSLLVSGVGSAEASNRGSTMYKLRKDGDTFEVVETFDGGVGVEHHCPDGQEGCCVDDCCACDASECGVCYCHKQCDEEQFN